MRPPDRSHRPSRSRIAPFAAFAALALVASGLLSAANVQAQAHVQDRGAASPAAAASAKVAAPDAARPPKHYVLPVTAPDDVFEIVKERREAYRKDIVPPTAEELAFSREEYRRELEELHKTRAERKRESVEDAVHEHRRLLHLPGFEDEMRVYADRMARFRRIGGLLIAEGRPYGLQMLTFALITQEHARHAAAIEALERRADELATAPRATPTRLE